MGNLSCLQHLMNREYGRADPGQWSQSPGLARLQVRCRESWLCGGAASAALQRTAGSRRRAAGLKSVEYRTREAALSATTCPSPSAGSVGAICAHRPSLSQFYSPPCSGLLWGQVGTRKPHLCMCLHKLSGKSVQRF